MAANRTFDRSVPRWSPTLAQAVVAGIALIALACGAVHLAEHSSSLPAEAVAALFEQAPADTGATPAPAAETARRAPPGERHPQPGDGPRECATERGTIDACPSR